MNTEYHFEFKVDDSSHWVRSNYVCYDKDSANKRFDEIFMRSNMEWRLVEDVIASSVIRNEKGKSK